MDLSGWAIYAVLAMASLAMVAYLYGRRELPGRGRKLLAGLRWLAIAILLLLLFDPEVPVSPLSGEGERVQVLLDGSLSMAAPLRPGEESRRWDEAAGEARRAAGRGGEVLVFGDSPRAVPVDSLAAFEPNSARSRLVPALRAAAEAGASRVVVVTDGAIDDLAEVDRIMPLLGMQLDIRTIGSEEVGNLGLAEVEAPVWAEAGKPFEVRVGVGGVGELPDSARIVLRQGDQVVTEGVVPAPEPGRLSTAVLTVTPEVPADGEAVRYEIALETGDPIPDDDRRSIFVNVDEIPAGLTLVSFRSDWEPRFLQPVLAQALGLPVRGYLQLQGGRFIRLASGPETGRPVEEAEVRRAVERAEIVVLHGLDRSSPEWARNAAGSSSRALIFPAGEGEIPGLPLRVTAPVPGDWAPSRTIPASPVTEFLTGLDVGLLPPLSSARRVEIPDGGWAPLAVERGAGSSAPVAIGLEDEGRRTVVALADGFWRWAFRDGAPRQAYRRLWSAVGGWLLDGGSRVDTAPLRPLERVVTRGGSVRWVAGRATSSTPDSAGSATDSVGLRITDAEGVAVVDTVLALVPGDTISLPALAPGSYRYEAVGAAASEGEPAAAAGEFVVESYSPEFLRAPVAISDFEAAAERAATIERGGATKPLHTEPWPYLALVLLVSTEWIFRRRWGLR